MEITQYTEECSLDAVNGIISSARVFLEEPAILTCPVNPDPLPDCPINSVHLNTKYTIEELKLAQNSDPIIGKIIGYKPIRLIVVVINHTSVKRQDQSTSE